MDYRLIYFCDHLLHFDSYDLGENELSGTIPTEVGNMKSLSVLDMGKS